jgi:hypothetical protein
MEGETTQLDPLCAPLPPLAPEHANGSEGLWPDVHSVRLELQVKA